MYAAPRKDHELRVVHCYWPVTLCTVATLARAHMGRERGTGLGYRPAAVRTPFTRLRT